MRETNIEILMTALRVAKGRLREIESGEHPHSEYRNGYMTYAEESVKEIEALEAQASEPIKTLQTGSHTPGPWITQWLWPYGVCPENGPYDDDGWADSYICITDDTPGNCIPDEEKLANTRLICAAPDLLAALERLLAAFQEDSMMTPKMSIRISWETNGGAIAEAHAAISRAKGESNASR